jgi:hypothetical protein
MDVQVYEVVIYSIIMMVLGYVGGIGSLVFKEQILRDLARFRGRNRLSDKEVQVEGKGIYVFAIVLLLIAISHTIVLIWMLSTS